uniref:Uncharacterized protein n=1 Tax=Utricularia reniformis TaxID=192314 RepID=A0A1Y0B1F7_9LAMI|nr:hypothetical protein AEK19_MT0994 [Utricularia reniformis]ART31218.1 hypothetical protein AEK19_MT0994 [Utricularia reniformis]
MNLPVGNRSTFGLASLSYKVERALLCVEGILCKLLENLQSHLNCYDVPTH